MKSIEERAIEFSKNTDSIIEACNKHGYLCGATEQKAIDIDKACEWYKSRGCHFVYSCDAIEDFRKVMEE